VVKGSVDKSSQFTDWVRRPLTEKQLRYARGDVVYLRAIYKILRAKLEKQDRMEWIADEHAALLDPDTLCVRSGDGVEADEDPQVSLGSSAVLANVSAWRERVSQETDKPRQRILKDDAIQEIARRKPRTLEALERMRAVQQGFGKSRHGAGLLQAINEALDNPEKYAPVVDEPERVQPAAGRDCRAAEGSAEAGVGRRRCGDAADRERSRHREAGAGEGSGHRGAERLAARGCSERRR